MPIPANNFIKYRKNIPRRLGSWNGWYGLREEKNKWYFEFTAKSSDRLKLQYVLYIRCTMSMYHYTVTKVCLMIILQWNGNATNLFLSSVF